ncbi:hypothetical protein A5767_16040 [Rhodococcus sp. 852002-51564_SCH6189132-a]|uniref:hypothetical protein n=1 Tax=Rhodococcus sp. 852002-51564_SCH6189132-a TaxID=1834103 RepID=UPI0007EA38B2|nr:hypothetical protein [Rhodococcus sp. 852002-51564_SCH6189132-a]OBA32733.1 hypothetical protein A5767_16040 [Rhodococcus sp. 852002-51564_SCH6189132-a]
MQDTIERIVGNGSAHGIRINVTPTGRIVALEIPPEAYSWSPDVLATRITAAHDLASADADEEAATRAPSWPTTRVSGASSLGSGS